MCSFHNFQACSTSSTFLWPVGNNFNRIGDDLSEGTIISSSLTVLLEMALSHLFKGNWQIQCGLNHLSIKNWPISERDTTHVLIDSQILIDTGGLSNLSISRLLKL